MRRRSWTAFKARSSCAMRSAAGSYRLKKRRMTGASKPGGCCVIWLHGPTWLCGCMRASVRHQGPAAERTLEGGKPMHMCMGVMYIVMRHSIRNRMCSTFQPISPARHSRSSRQAMLDAVEQCAQYPDPFCRALTTLWPRLTDCRLNILLRKWCGAGILRLADVLRPQTALVTAPTFAEYEAALTHFGCKVRHHGASTGKLRCYSAHSGRAGRRGCVHPVHSEQSHWPDD